MGSARVATAVAAASLVGAGLMLAGRANGSAVTVVLLILTARAALIASDPRAVDTMTLGRLAASVPLWVGVVLVGALRAGAADVDAIRGAHAVAGLALARGDALIVIASWLGMVAAIVALSTVSPRAERLGRDPVLGAVVVLHVLLITTVFAGPHVSAWTDLIPWALGVAAVGAGALALRDRLASWPVLTVTTSAVAVAVILASLGAPL